ncbi:MAG: DNA alkylation repair protein [Acholeplasma sp.]|nr:DNA alkylation repair protein [Acholeplasma sp.]
MDLKKATWKESDKKAFIHYLESLGDTSKVNWSKNILNTTSDVLAIKTKVMVKVANDILKGNYQSFLELQITDYYETIALYGMILNRMPDKASLITYLNPYLDMMNSWAHCDLLKFPFLEKEKDTYLELSKAFRFDHREMVRRLSLYILFMYVKDNTMLKYIFEAIIDLEKEEAYYVIMMAGWLLSECLIKHKDSTESFLKNQSINPKIVNKAIQKCRESNRLTTEEKETLLKYKIKNK